MDFVSPTGAVSRRRGRFGERVIDYRDYLVELARKPQAVRQVAAQLVADLGEPFGSAWRLLVDAHGPKQAARIFAKVLAHIETRGARDVGERVALALATDQPVLLALAPPMPPGHALAAELVPAHLRHLGVETASASDYDALVGGDS